MGFEEVLIRFFDRMSSAKKVKSGLYYQNNFSESTSQTKAWIVDCRLFRLTLLRSRFRKINAHKGYLLAHVECYVVGDLTVYPMSCDA